jgi:hypothetical protein
MRKTNRTIKLRCTEQDYKINTCLVSLIAEHLGKSEQEVMRDALDKGIAITLQETQPPALPEQVGEE